MLQLHLGTHSHILNVLIDSDILLFDVASHLFCHHLLVEFDVFLLLDVL